MGTDDLFRKRKDKKARELARRKPRREPYTKVLIVCEGEKTEPNYFNDLKDHYGLNSANVEICGDSVSDPLGIVRYAKQRYKDEKGAGDPFDRVYCVFDRDSHDKYRSAIEDIHRAMPKDTFIAITSVPCFEYWLLLHFIYTTKPYAGMPRNSPCNQLITDLKNHLPAYEKGQRGIFSSIVTKLESAKDNAVRALKAARENRTDNPSTYVHELVEFLQRIKT